jgi:hypothetical protein
MKTINKYWIEYKVEGSERIRQVVTNAVSEKQAKANVQDMFGKDINIEYLNIINNGEVKSNMHPIFEQALKPFGIR